MTSRRVAIALLAFSTILIGLPAYSRPDLSEYVVVLEPTEREVADVANELARSHNGKVGFVYTAALQGFTIALPAAAVNGIARNPSVSYVEPVQEIQAFGTQPIPTGIDRIESDINPPTVPMDVDIAILDTGVYIGQNPDGSARSHLDLNLRYVSDCTGAILYPLIPPGCRGSGDFQDGHGHGTHVAGIAAALDNDIGTIGVAPGATLWSFKVLENDGTGTTGMVLAGIDAVASQAHLIEVANLSLGFDGFSQAIDDAIANAVNEGVVFVVAAGNSAADASTFSPASGPDVITVSALADFDGLPFGLASPTCRLDVDDTLADFSNYGPAVEIAAPGVCIYSTDLQDGYSLKSGTSMASPFVAGAVARYIAENGLDPQSRSDVMAIRAAIIGAGMDQANVCGFTDIDNSPEPLLFLNGPLFGGDGECGSGAAANLVPTADFSEVCTDLTCIFSDQSSDPDGSVVSWSWDFGDSAVSTDQNPSHTYATGGNYTVTLTVTDDAGGSDELSRTVNVSDPANIDPLADFSSSCVFLDCTFTDLSSDPDGTIVFWSWEFGDGGSSLSQNPDHAYGATGTYSVTLTVTDDRGGTDLIVQSVIVSDPPNTPPTADFDETCDVLTCVFTDLSSDLDGSVTSWSWDFGDGGTAASQNPSHTYGTSGTYTVTPTVVDDDGDSATTSRDVSVTEPAASTTIVVAAYPILIDSPDGREAHLDIWVTDGDGLPLAGAAVEGVWTYSDKRGRTKTSTDAGTTSAGGDLLSGNLTLSRRFPPESTIESFCVTNVSLDGYTYSGGVPCAFVLAGAAHALAISNAE